MDACRDIVMQGVPCPVNIQILMEVPLIPNLNRVDIKMCFGGFMICLHVFVNQMLCRHQGLDLELNHKIL